MHFFLLFPLIVRSFMLDSCRFFIHFSVEADLFVCSFIHSFIHLFYYNHPRVHNPSIDFNPCSICQYSRATLMEPTLPTFPHKRTGMSSISKKGDPPFVHFNTLARLDEGDITRACASALDRQRGQNLPIY